MTAQDQLRPAAPVPGLTLDPMDRGSPLVPDIQARIGAPYKPYQAGMGPLVRRAPQPDALAAVV